MVERLAVILRSGGLLVLVEDELIFVTGHILEFEAR